MIYSTLVRPAFPVETALFAPLASAQQNIPLDKAQPASAAHHWTEPVSNKATTTFDEPRSLLRYVVMAALLVVPALVIFSAHVETSVVPVASYVAQVYGGHAPTRIAAEGK